MKLTTVKEIYKEREKYLDKEVTVGGWVRSVRDSKTFGFIVLHDGTFFETLQVVYHDTMENFAEISKLNVYWYTTGKISVRKTGKIIRIPREAFEQWLLKRKEKGVV